MQASRDGLSLALDAFPWLLWSRPVVASLLAALEADETCDGPGTAGIGSGADGPAWLVLQAWVRHASERAPAATQALLHSFLAGCASSGLSIECRALTRCEVVLRRNKRAKHIGRQHWK